MSKDKGVDKEFDTPYRKNKGTVNLQRYRYSPIWRAKRKAVLDRARQRCEMCGKRARLEVCHKTFDSLFAEPLTDLVALCHSCHLLWKRLDLAADDPENS